MAINSFKQNAGDNSTQVSAGIIINNGLSREEVCRILQDEAKKILAEANELARQIASDRIDSFFSVLIDKLVSSGHLEVFRDPAMHVTLRMAQKPRSVQTKRQTMRYFLNYWFIALNILMIKWLPHQ